jgi:hypothetical protein
MTAVVDSAARFRRIVHGAEVLPFRGAHFRACCRGTWGIVGEKSGYNRVHFLREEAAKLIQPQGVVDVFGRVCESVGHFSVDG